MYNLCATWYKYLHSFLFTYLPTYLNANLKIKATDALRELQNTRNVESSSTNCKLNHIFLPQEQLKKRKEEEERIAAQNEFLNRSLRGSRKLQALESKPQGAVNDAFADDDAHDTSRSTTPGLVGEKEVVHTPYGRFSLFVSLWNAGRSYSPVFYNGTHRRFLSKPEDASDV